MTTKETGGPAYPTGTYEYDGQQNILTYQADGMTLRDYFAAKAMQGYLASFHPQSEPAEFAGTIAKDAYIIADAMLEARK